MKSAKDWWNEWSIPEVHGTPPNGWDHLIESIRDEMREECVKGYVDWMNSPPSYAAHPKGIDAIRNAGREPRFKSGQLVIPTGTRRDMLPWIRAYNPEFDLAEGLEPVLDINGEPVFLKVEDDR